LRGLLSDRHGQRWLLGTHQGGVQPQHLDEFTFRFNRRRSKARGLPFHRLAEQAVAVDPAPYPTQSQASQALPRDQVSEGDTQHIEFISATALLL
jgi:hypothetical protein